MEQLKNELAKLVYDYSINRKYADKKFVDKALTLCINAFDINDYVRKCEVKAIEDKETYAGYNIENKEVIIDISSCIISALDRVSEEEMHNVKSSEFLKYVKVNLNVINGVIHELTHARQYKKCINGEDDLEKRILMLTLDRNIRVLTGYDFSAKEVAYYKSLDKLFKGELYYTATPSERMANITALGYENEISKLLPSEEKEYLDYYTELNLISGQMQAYRDVSPSPFITSVNEIMKEKWGLPYGEKEFKKIEKAYNELAIKNKLTVAERIFLGLPIDKVDRHKIDKKVNKLRNRIFR